MKKEELTKLRQEIITELEKEKIEGGLIQELTEQEYHANPCIVNIAVLGCIRRVKKVIKKYL